MSSSHPLVEGVVEACHSGNVGTLQALLTQHPELDINLATEGGVTLLMHTIIGAGDSTYTFTHGPLPSVPVAMVCYSFLLQVQGPTLTVSTWRCVRCWFNLGYTWILLILLMAGQLPTGPPTTTEKIFSLS